MQNWHPEIGNIVEMVQLWTGSKYVSLQNVYEKVWTRVFVEGSGPCFSFDLSKVEQFKHISLMTDSRPGIEFVIAENNIWQKLFLFLHTRFDLPDAGELNGYLPLSFSDKIKEAHKVELLKKISKRESTRKAACVEYELKTCRSIENNKSIFEKFHCTIPVLYSGQHLDDVIPNGASNCSHQVMLEALDFIFEKGNNCTLIETCQNTRFTSHDLIQETWFENKTLVYVTFKNPEVEYRQSYISYDFISLIGEIGGILGITLGASALTLFESIFKRFLIIEDNG